MIVQSLLPEPGWVNEPHAAQDYSDMLTQVVAEGKPVIVRRDGVDLAAVIPLEYLELLREVVAHGEVEKHALEIDWSRVSKALRPPQVWFDETENPCTPEQEPRS